MSLSSGPPTIPNTFFFDLLPKIALAGLAIVVAVIIWSIWRSVSPAAPGISMGYLEILGRYGGGKMLKSIRGTLVDSTPLFLNPRVERLFRQMLIEDITNKLKLASAGKQTKPESKSKDSTPSESTASSTTALEETKEETKDILEDALAEFKDEKEPLSKLCRIIITRKHFFGKDVIVQWGNVGPLSEYAAVEPESKFTFSMGFLTQGIVTGELETFSEEWTIDKLGDCTVHLFKPDVYRFEGGESEEASLIDMLEDQVSWLTVRENPPPVEQVVAEIKKTAEQLRKVYSKNRVTAPPAYLAKIALHASSYVEAEEQLASKDDQITQLKRENAKMGTELSGKATEVDGLYTATKGFETEGGPALTQLAPKRFGLNEFVFLFAPTVIGYIAARYWNFEPLYGVFAGLAAGAYLVSRRMG
jgi:hypothetical protein